MSGAPTTDDERSKPAASADHGRRHATHFRSPADACQHGLEHFMKVRPLHDRIIVDRLDEGEQQIGGIIIPDSAKEKPQRGIVVAAGHGRVAKDGKVVPLDVKAGDQVLFGKYSGQEIRLGGKDLFIMKEDDVLAVIDNPKKSK
jgi:chaperonin GroES